jgi:secondary thiamine-phosphate synthase enzyme
VTVHRQELTVSTRGRGTTEITDRVQAAVRGAGVDDGVCTVFCHHTSASLMISENADPSVRRDIERFLARVAPDGDPAYEHSAEGPDDMPAHLRTLLTQSALTLPVARGRADLGTWQGVFLYEHRTSPHRRRLTILVQG